MEAIRNFNAPVLLDTFVSVFSAFVLGSLVGLERQFRQRTAGLRTNALVAVGAAVFVDLGIRLTGHDGGMRVAAYVVSGIGFLGAGAIMKQEANIVGLNTAATLWATAAVGACCGADLIGEAVIAALFVLAANTLLRPVVNRINRHPVDEHSAEATYAVHLICRRELQHAVRTQLDEALEAARYPARDIRQQPFGNAETQIEATLYATAVDAEELDRLAERLRMLPGVVQVAWNPSDAV